MSLETSETEMDKAHGFVKRCVKDGLSTTGADGSDVILYFLSKKFGLSTDAIAEDPETLVFGLRSFLSVGAVPILRTIVNELEESKFTDDASRNYVYSYAEVLVTGIGEIETGIM